MEHISARQTAEKWGVSLRRVQIYLQEGRIAGAVRVGRLWMIPADAEKPGDPRKPKQKCLSTDFAQVIEATIVPMPRHHPAAVLDTVGEDRLRLHLEGELAYLCGDFERVIACFHRTKGDNAARLRACSLTIAAAITTGDYALFSEIEAYLKDVIDANIGTAVSAVAQLSLDTAYVSAIAPNMVSDWVKSGDLRAVPPKVKPDAVYRRAKYFQCLGKFDVMLATAQTGLAFCPPDQEITFPGIYLRLSCAVACCAMGQMSEAEHYLMEALHICLPHGFITPFAESVTAFGGLLEKCLKRDFPAYHDMITQQWQDTFANWISFHNYFTQNNITSILSLHKYEIAQLAAKRMPYTKIAKRLDISVGQVKSTLSEIYAELLISDKRELSKFIL